VDLQLAGKVALVTGSSKGIGDATGRHALKTILMLALCILPMSAGAVDPFDPAPGLDAEIAAWKPGSEVPHRLLAFPEGNVRSIEDCGLAAYATSVLPFMNRIEDDALLEAVVFDPRVESTSMYAAASRLVDRKGLGWFAHALARNRDVRWELGVLEQALAARYSKMQVAYISHAHMSATKAIAVLGQLRFALMRGESWKEAYAKISDANPDIERRKQEPQVATTLVSYWFDGWIAASGFSASDQGFKRNSNLPAMHLKTVVGSRGIHILSAADGVYLYNVTDTWTPDPQGRGSP
jgi:hypothetical protein